MNLRIVGREPKNNREVIALFKRVLESYWYFKEHEAQEPYLHKLVALVDDFLNTTEFACTVRNVYIRKCNTFKQESKRVYMHEVTLKNRIDKEILLFLATR